jgi:16S rRNA (adenine(1408)-N(1))-methyltransferase
LDFTGLAERLAGYRRIHVDLGTGDGRYVRSLAAQHPDRFVIGLDPCRENLREHSQARLENMLFIIASAQELPRELDGLADQVTINFPWGSLLESLLAGDSRLAEGLARMARTEAGIDIRLNGGALAEAGAGLETGTEQIRTNARAAGWQMNAAAPMAAPALRTYPTTWARRLAHGRDPRAMGLTGRLMR